MQSQYIISYVKAKTLVGKQVILCYDLEFGQLGRYT